MVAGQIRFYGVKATNLSKVISSLLIKAFNSHKKSLVVVDTKQSLVALDDKLWTSTPWLPHGTQDDPRPCKQPILLVYDLENYYNSQKEVLYSYLFGLNINTIDMIIKSKFNIKVLNLEKVIILFNIDDLSEFEVVKSQCLYFKSQEFEIICYKESHEGKLVNTNI